MPSMGFRPPQFSEDVAWLPAWLQQHGSEPSDGKIRENQQIYLEQNPEELPSLRESLHVEEDKNMSSREERGYQSCHLFLSGDDNSLCSFGLSSGNVVSFQLHLSFDSNSESVLTPVLEAQAERLESNHALKMSQIETLVVPEEKINQFKVEYDACLMNPSAVFQHEISKTNSLRSFQNTKNKGTKNKGNVKFLKVPRTNDALELAITASEALVIHEAIKNGSETKSLPASALLEVALRVKQARLDVLEETSHFSTKEISEIDFLTDLDESAMADVYEDVGLSATGDLHGCDLVVRDTFASEDYGFDDEMKCGELGALGIGGTDICKKQHLEGISDIDAQSKDFALETSDGNRKRKRYEDQALDSNTRVAHHLNPTLLASVQKISDVPATIETINSNLGDTSSVQSVNSTKLASSKEAGRDYERASVVPGRFHSRWLGGWTPRKEVKAYEPSKHDDTKRIPQLLVTETSFLSESADIAPDKHSFVQKEDKGPNTTSQSSIPFEGLCRDANEGILSSGDIVRCSIQSFTDPLCSVVPCSISSEKACSSLFQKNHNGDIDAKECLSSTQEHNMGNFWRTSDLDTKSVNEEALAVPATNRKYSQPTVHRRFTSLGTYSMMMPGYCTLLEKRPLCFSPSFPLECNAKIIPSVMQNKAVNLMNENRSYNATIKDGVDFPFPLQKRNSPLNVNHKANSHYQDSERIMCDFGEEADLQQVSIPETDMELPQCKNIQGAQTYCKKPSDAQVLERKRVRFSDMQINFAQKKKLRYLQSIHCNRSNMAAGKQLKCSNPYSEFGGQECKGLLTKCVNKVSKRQMLQNIEFLLTGFSTQKEKEIESLIRNYGGIILSDIPSPPNATRTSVRSNHWLLPVILCCKKLQTLKFLYGCAVNACILTINWLTDSIAAGSPLPPQKYAILPNHVGKKCARVGKPVPPMYMFDRVGIMLHGKPKFCTKMAKIIKHGGGRVFSGLQWLVQSRDSKKISLGVVVAEDESRASRHLKHCASEQKILMMPVSWIIKSLYVGKLLPFVETNLSSHLMPIQPLQSSVSFQ